ncbi:MAG: ThiF family adenylyltransferase [Planctomycetes bacterium]|nr:ThiF family adenylyltransferase [Planctomycetota bacterium]
MAAFTEDQIRRYSRHILLPEVGGKGQRRLLAARVLLLGAAGPGAVAAGYLAAAGVGRLEIADGAAVAPADLADSMFFVHADLGRPRAHALRDALAALNPEVQVNTWSDAEAARVGAAWDLVLLGAPAAPAGLAAWPNARPLIWGAARGAHGWRTALALGDGPSLACVQAAAEKAAPPAAGDVDLAAPVAGLVGSLTAVEVVKALLGKGELACGVLVRCDGLRGLGERVVCAPRPGCPACGGERVRERSG